MIKGVAIVEHDLEYKIYKIYTNKETDSDNGNEEDEVKTRRK